MLNLMTSFIDQNYGIVTFGILRLIKIIGAEKKLQPNCEGVLNEGLLLIDDVNAIFSCVGIWYICFEYSIAVVIRFAKRTKDALEAESIISAASK
ncbi:hypothetical protein Tco_0739526 [Tanacetum coccineum]